MSEINWNELKDKAHSNAVKHGFWVDQMVHKEIAQGAVAFL